MPDPVHGRGRAFADKKNDAKFSPGPASSYPTKQTNDKVTLAAVAYDTEELAHTAFGKLDPNQYGVLPVLVIIQNDTDQALKLDHVEVEYTGVDNRHVEATPASDVQTLGGPPKQPPWGMAARYRLHESTRIRWSAWEIEGRASRPRCCRRMNRPTAFSISRPTHRPGAKFYLTGIKMASTGQDILYFEIALDKQP